MKIDLKGGEFLNLYPTASGVIRRVESEMNAVLVNYIPGEPDEDGNPQYMRVVTIACANEEMLPFLRERAREIIGY